MRESFRKRVPLLQRMAARLRSAGRAFRIPRVQARVGTVRIPIPGDGMLFGVAAAGFAVLGIAGAIPAGMKAGLWLEPSAALTFWALGCAAAATLPAPGVAVAGIWLAHAGALMFSAAGNTWLLLLPAVWMLIPGTIAVARDGPGPATGFGWVILSLGAGWMIADFSGFNARLGWGGAAGWRGAILVGTICGWAGWQVATEWRTRQWPIPTPAVVLALSLGAAGAVGMMSASRSFSGFAGWIQEVIALTRTGAAFGWYIAAGGFGLLLVWCTGRVSAAAVHLLTLRGFVRGVTAAWILITAVEWLITNGALAVPAWLYAGVAMHRWAGVAVLVMAAGFAWQGARGTRHLLRLNALWLMAAIASLAIAPALQEGGVTENPEVIFRGWWPPAILAGGLLWFGWRMALAGELRSGTQAVRASVVAGLIGTYTLTGPGWPAPGIALACAAGLLHLTLPCALYAWATRHRDPAERLPVLTQVWLCALGMFVALPMVKWNAGSLWLLATAPILWAGVLVLCGRNLRSAGRPEGALAGALVAGGTLAAWMFPGILLPEVPYLDVLNPPQEIAADSWAVTARPVFQRAHFHLLVAMEAAGAVMGAWLLRPRSGNLNAPEVRPPLP